MAKDKKDDGLSDSERRKYNVLNVLSFGYLKRKAKHINQQKEDVNVKKNFDLTELERLLGTNNCLDCKLISNNSVQIMVRDVAQVQLSNLKTYTQAIGTMKSNTSVTLITKSAVYVCAVLKKE